MGQVDVLEGGEALLQIEALRLDSLLAVAYCASNEQVEEVDAGATLW